jgi:hypothetical protein
MLHSNRSVNPPESPADRNEKIRRFARDVREPLKSRENRALALDELARLGARDELYKIATSPFEPGEIRRRARELLKSLE